jgi:hypothetical protein
MLSVQRITSYAARSSDKNEFTMPLIIHCADIGSVYRGNFGWARLAVDEPDAVCTTGHDIGVFADGIASDLNSGAHVAVGFECPLFLPVPEDPNGLTSARPGEGDRAWSAGAGAGSLATGLTETVWILERVKRKISAAPAVFVKWQAFRAATGGLFVWEAFVTKAAKTDTHHGDAELAVMSFRDGLPDPEQQNAVICNGPVRSLIGAALMQAGWANELKWLAESCLVIRALPRGGAA